MWIHKSIMAFGVEIHSVFSIPMWRHKSIMASGVEIHSVFSIPMWRHKSLVFFMSRDPVC